MLLTKLFFYYSLLATCNHCLILPADDSIKSNPHHTVYLDKLKIYLCNSDTGCAFHTHYVSLRSNIYICICIYLFYRLFAERDNILFLFDFPIVPGEVFVQVLQNWLLKLIFHNILFQPLSAIL